MVSKSPTETDQRELRIRAEMERCIHFNGVQNAKCKAGVPYDAPGHDGPIPCIRIGAATKPAWHCDMTQHPSREQAEAEIGADDTRLKLTLNGLFVARTDADSKGLKKGSGGASSIPCPSGCGGTLKYSVASYNGHMHARCSTEGCLSWMQ